MADEFDPYSKGVEYQVTKVDPTDPTTKGAVYQVHKVDEVTAAMSGKFYRARIIKDPSEPTVKGKVYQIVIIDDPDDPSVKGKVYNAIITGDQEAVVVGPAVPPLDLDSAVADTLTYVKAYGGTKLSYDIPVEYTQVDGAIKTGGYGVEGKFDTVVKITNDDVKMEVLVKAGNMEQQGGQTTMGSFYCCQARSASNAPIYGISGSSTGDTIIGVVNGEFITSTITRTTNHLYFIRFEYKNGNQTLYVKDLTDNTEDTKTGTYTFASPTTNFYIFGNSATTNRVNNGNTIYSCKIWNAGTLAFNAVSVKRDSDNAVGLYDSVRDRFIEPIVSEGGGFVAGDVTTPTPSDPMDIYCNNGVLKVLDKSQWTIITNPSSIAGQGAYINTSGKWQVVGDRSEGCVIPLTVGKQYTMVIHKKTIALGTMLRYGQSPRATPTNDGVQLTDWYRGTIADGMMISFVAKQPYFVTQFNADPTEAGMIQEAIEVIEAQGAGYTFVDYIKSDGSAYIDTGISPDANTVAEVVCQSEEGAANRNIFGSGLSNTTGVAKNSVFVMSTYNNTEFETKVFETTADTTFIRFNGDITQKNTLSVSGDGSIKMNGVVMATQTATPLPNNKPIWLFARWKPTASGVNPKVSIYSFKVWQNNVLVQNLIPAIRNSDNVVGMYDTVSGTFLTNAGTGTFVAGTPLGDGEVLKLTPSNDTAGVANLLKIDNYVDTQEILTGLINHKLGICVLNGLETYNVQYPFYIHSDSCDAFVSINDAKSVSAQDAIGACTHLKLEKGTIWSGSGYPNTFTFNTNQLHLNFAHDVIGTTSSSTTEEASAAIKSYIATQYSAGTPVIIVYPLATAQGEVAPVPQTMQVVAGDNVLDIVQAGMGGLEVEVQYTKEG